jgi:hypothetical protein
MADFSPRNRVSTEMAVFVRPVRSNSVNQHNACVLMFAVVLVLEA